MKLPKKNNRPPSDRKPADRRPADRLPANRSAKLGSELDTMSRMPSYGERPSSPRRTPGGPASGRPQTGGSASGGPASAPSQRYRRSAYQGNRQMSRTARAGRTPVRRVRKKPEERPIFANGRIDTVALKARAKKLAKEAIAGISIEREDVIKGTVIALLMIFFALLQTTVFTRLPPLGAVPDLMLSFVIAVAVMEGERWGAVVSLFAALVISSLGSVGANDLSIVYLAAAYVSGILSRYYLRRNALIRLMYQVVAGFLRGAGTLVMLALVSPEFTLPEVMLGTVLPEYFSTLLLSPIVHFIVWLALAFFHRSRAQRTGDQ